jgi:hypothetical protein
MKIYHCRTGSGVWCASQPHLLATMAGIQPTTDEDKISFYRSERFGKLANSSIGNTTIYDEISQVLPNHCFDVLLNRTKRYWPEPGAKRRRFSVKDCARLAAPMIRGFVENIHARYRIMLPVTAGKDSRTLLAATHRIKNDVYYYINAIPGSTEKEKDINLPSSLFRELGIDFHILDPCSTGVDEGFKALYFQNNPYASERFLQIIYNYYQNFGDRVNLPGNIATGACWFYPTRKKTVDAALLTRLNQVDSFGYALENYTEWLDGCKDVCRRTGYHPTELFYWEERLGNWGTQTTLDKDIAQNDINPYNSRDLVSLLLSVYPDYAVDLGRYLLNKEIINLLWPQVLNVPINPGVQNTILSLLSDFRIIGFLYSYKYG